MKKFNYLAIVLIALVFAGCDPDNIHNPKDAATFSVSENKKVIFSPGNLQYHPKNDKWRFAPNQTDYIGDANSNIAPDYDGWIDLFGWGTGNNPTNNSTDPDDYLTFVDWGINKIDNYAPNTWRTLTYDEWDYLLNIRTNADILKGIAQVDGVNGLILLPDSWDASDKVNFKSGFHGNSGRDYYAEYQTITRDKWSKMKNLGAVFFPAAGDREGHIINYVQGSGYYWSSTMEYGDGLFMFLYTDEVIMFYYNCSVGHSVRLVQDVK